MVEAAAREARIAQEQAAGAAPLVPEMERFPQIGEIADRLTELFNRGISGGTLYPEGGFDLAQPEELATTLRQWFDDLGGVANDLERTIHSPRFTADASPQIQEALRNLSESLRISLVAGEETFEQSLVAARNIADAPGNIGAMFALGPDAATQWQREGYTIEPLVRHGDVLGWINNLKTYFDTFADQIDITNAYTLNLRLDELRHIASHSTFPLNPGRNPMGAVPSTRYRYMEEYTSDFYNLTHDPDLGGRPVNRLWESPLAGPISDPSELSVGINSVLTRMQRVLDEVVGATGGDMHRAISDLPNMFQEQVTVLLDDVDKVMSAVREIYDRITLFAPPRSATGPVDIPVTAAETEGIFTDFLDDFQEVISPVVRVFEPSEARIVAGLRQEAAELDIAARRVPDEIPDDAPLETLSPAEIRRAFAQHEAFQRGEEGVTEPALFTTDPAMEDAAEEWLALRRRAEDEVGAARERIRTQRPEPEVPEPRQEATPETQQIELMDDLPPDAAGDYDSIDGTIGYNNNLNRRVPDEFRTPDRREAPMGPMGQWLDQAYIENLVSGGIVEQPTNLSMFYPDPTINRPRLLREWVEISTEHTAENFPSPLRLEEVYDARTGQFDMRKILNHLRDPVGSGTRGTDRMVYAKKRLDPNLITESVVTDYHGFRLPYRSVQVGGGNIMITGRPMVVFTDDPARPWIEWGTSGRRGIELHWEYSPAGTLGTDRGQREVLNIAHYFKKQLMPQLDQENIELGTFLGSLNIDEARTTAPHGAESGGSRWYAERKSAYEAQGVRFFDADSSGVGGRWPETGDPSFARAFTPPRVHTPWNRNVEFLNPSSSDISPRTGAVRGLANREIPEIGSPAYEHLLLYMANHSATIHVGFRVPARKPPGVLATGAAEYEGREIPVWLREVADVLDFKPEDNYVQALVAWNARTEPAVSYGLIEQQVDNLLAVRARYGSFETFLLEQNGLRNPTLEQMANVESMAAFLEHRARKLAEIFNLAFFPKNSDDLLRSQAARFGMPRGTIESMDRRDLIELMKVTPENGGYDGGQGISGTVEDAFPHEGALPGQRVRYQLSSGAYESNLMTPDFEDFQAVWSAEGLGPLAEMNSRVALDLSGRGSVRMYGTSPWQREAVRQEVLGLGSAARDPWEMENLGRMYGTPPRIPGDAGVYQGRNIQPHTFGQLADRRIRDNTVLGDGNPFRGEAETDVLLRQTPDELRTIISSIIKSQGAPSPDAPFAEYWSLAIRLSESPTYRPLFAQNADSHEAVLQSALDFVFWRNNSDWANGIAPIGQTAGQNRARWHPPAWGARGPSDRPGLSNRMDRLDMSTGFGGDDTYVSRGFGPGTTHLPPPRRRIPLRSGDPGMNRMTLALQEELYARTGLGNMWENMGLWEHVRAPGRTASTVNLEDITPMQSDNLIQEILRFQAAVDPALNPFSWALNVQEVRTSVGNSASVLLRSIPEEQLSRAYKAYRLSLAGDGYNAVAWPNTSRVPVRGSASTRGAPDASLTAQGETPVMADYPGRAATPETGELAQPPFRAPIDTDVISPGAFNRFNVDIVPTNPAALVALDVVGDEVIDPASYVKWFEDKAVRAMMDTPPLRDGPMPDALQVAIENEQMALSNFEMLDRAWAAQFDSLTVLETELGDAVGELEVLKEAINYGRMRGQKLQEAKASLTRLRESRLRLGENMDPGTVDIERWVAEQEGLIEDLTASVLLLGQKDLEEFQGILQLLNSQGYKDARAGLASSQKVLGMKQGLPWVEAVIDRGFRAGYKPIGVESSGPEGFVDALQTAFGWDQRGRANGFTKYYDKAHNLTKGYMIFSPGFFFRNYYGGMFMNYLANVPPVRYVQFIKANKVIQLENRLAVKGAEATQKELKKLERKQGKVPQEHLVYVRELEEAGAFGPGQTGIEFEPTLTPMGSTVRIGGKEITLQSLNLFSSQFFALRGARNVNMKVETLLRGALGFDRLVAGRGLDEAIDDIVKFHFDYDDLSRFERGVVKRAVPFYTWTRRAIPLMVEQYAKRPQVFHNYIRGMRMVEADESQQEGVFPQWLMRQGGVPLNLKFGGENMFLAPDLPPRTMFDMVNPATRGGLGPEERMREVARAATGMLTPFAKAPMEFYTKRNFWKGYHFNGTMEWVPPVMTAIPGLMVALEQAGAAEKNENGHWGMRDYRLHTFFQLLPLMGTARRLSGAEEKYSERWLSTWISFMLGIGLRTNTQYEQEMELRGRQYRARDERSEERQLERIRPDE